MTRNRIQCFAFAILAAVAVTASADGPQLRWEQNDDGVLVTEGDSNVLFYQRSDKALNGKHVRANYVHPLYDLDENVLTEDFPADHLHHRGVFWAWHQLRIGNQNVGDGWALSDLRWDVRELTPQQNPDGSLTLSLVVDWKSPRWRGGEEAIVVEHSSVRVFPRRDDRREIDFDIQLRATNPETFIGGSEDDKGYGGFSVRIKLPKNIVFTGLQGVVTPQKTAVDPSPWMSMTGTLGDPPPQDAGESGLTVLCHPDSAGYPQPWILRAQRSMQNPVWPGRQPQLLSDEHPTMLRYRLVIHRDPVSPAVIQGWQSDYAQMP